MIPHGTNLPGSDDQPPVPPLVGGYERAAERLSAALAEAGLRVVVITERRERAWPAMEFIDSYKVRRLSCLYVVTSTNITSLLSFASYLLRHGRAFDVWQCASIWLSCGGGCGAGQVAASPGGSQNDGYRHYGNQKNFGQRSCGGILVFFHRRVSACIAVQ